MPLEIPNEIIEATTSDELAKTRANVKIYGHVRATSIDPGTLSVAGLTEILNLASTAKNTRIVRGLQSLINARQGQFDTPVPNYDVFQPLMEEFLRHNVIDGWIYERRGEEYYPFLVISIRRQTMHGREETTNIKIEYYGLTETSRNVSICCQTRELQFDKKDVSRKRLADILEAKGFYKETPELRAAYDAAMTQFTETVAHGYAKEYMVSGRIKIITNGYQFEDIDVTRRRVIHDTPPEKYGPRKNFSDSEILGEDGGIGQIPEHPIVRVFDVKNHIHFAIHAIRMTRYVYDKSLRNKIILPKTHHDLLDILTTDISAFTADIIEGKSAGNVILCKGLPGVGKTLTAEIYSELIEKPLYSVHTGTLGTTPDKIRENLKNVFEQSTAWEAVLLLDECDIFVAQRGSDIEQNAIVAEFLRVLEYFEGLLFMTTNRPNNIDEAIISRCAAIIEYHIPSESDAKAIWKVMSEQFNADLTPAVIDDLVKLFPKIAPRDIKMLLRLALRVSLSEKKPLDHEMFRKCAMFRAIEMEPV